MFSLTEAQRQHWAGDHNAFVDGLLAWYQRVGASHGDEQVTQLEHALQTAHHARQDSAPEAEIVAALMHDVGPFLAAEHQHRGDFLSRDLRHEEIGTRWLVPGLESYRDVVLQMLTTSA